MVYLRVLSLTYYSFHGTKRLHEDMVEHVFRAPVNLYFDTTPLGRVLNRFSKDLSVIESTLVFEIGTGYVNFYNLLSIFGLAIFQTNRGYDFLQGIVFAIGAGLGLTLALVLMASIRETSELSDIPAIAKGTGLTLIIAGSLSLAFMGFAGLL